MAWRGGCRGSYFGGEPEDYDVIKASADIGRDIEATDLAEAECVAVER